VNHRVVAKTRGELSDAETGTVPGCSVCEEDQDWIQIPGVERFRICRKFKKPIEALLLQSAKRGFPLKEIVGYRVGKSKGPIDKNGLRTQFSNHSFGVSIDINASFNGLYENCKIFSEKCRLLRGGTWRPGPEQVTLHSVIYQSFRELGWKWGGELLGLQKDFMHFSPSGD
jgi:hypothetical protein